MTLLFWKLPPLSAASIDEDALILANKSWFFFGAICSLFSPMCHLTPFLGGGKGN